MHVITNFNHSLACRTWHTTTVALASGFALALTLIFTLPGQSQTFRVIHTFTGWQDGGRPTGLTMDRAGNLYGTTYEGGKRGGNCDRVYDAARWPCP